MTFGKSECSWMLWFLLLGEWMHENKDFGRLLLLCVRTPHISPEPRQELCENGAGHVWSYKVSEGTIGSFLTVWESLVMFLTPDCFCFSDTGIKNIIEPLNISVQRPKYWCVSNSVQSKTSVKFLLLWLTLKYSETEGEICGHREFGLFPKWFFFALKYLF